MNKPMGKIMLKTRLCPTCGIKFLVNPISEHYHLHNGKKFNGRSIGWSRKYLEQ